MKEDMEQKFRSMPLGDHLEELRVRLILAILGLGVCMFGSLFLSKWVIDMLRQPYIDVMDKLGMEAVLTVLAPSEGFMIYLKIALVCGIIISSPWILYHLWMFVAEGLYKHERKFVYRAVPLCTGLFVGGAAFCVWIATPVTLKFFIKFNTAFLGAKSNFTFQHYINYVLNLILIFGGAFQTPVVVYLLNWLGLITLNQLKKWRPYVLLVITIVAAAITPTGPIILLILAGPMYMLYEFGILLCLIAGPKKK